MNETRSLRKKVYELLEGQETAASLWLNRFIMALIFANVLAVMAESMEHVAARYGTPILWFDLCSVTIFSVEYLLRLWSAPENPRFHASRRPRLRWAVTPMALVDFFAVAPFFLSRFTAVDTRILRALRLVRLFKLTRYSTSMELMMTVVRKEAASFASAVFVMLIIIVLSASGIYVVERESQPENFGSIPAAMWWATVTLTTVGYGDVVPQTVVGRLLGMLITIAGVGMAALPAGIVASGFSRELELRRHQFQASVEAALADGKLSQNEELDLQAGAQELGLRADEAEQVVTDGASRAMEPQEAQCCPHCGEVLGEFSDSPP